MTLFLHQQALHASLDGRRSLFGAPNTQKLAVLHGLSPIPLPPTFLSMHMCCSWTMHTSSSTIHSYCSKIIGHFEWRKMARGSEQVTLEAGFTISIVAEIHLRCIRRTTVPWPYELRLGSMTCQKDRSENSYPSITHFVCFGIISEAENGLEN